MNLKLRPILSKKNVHPRDQNIEFAEEGHKYFITTDIESTYTSVTTWNQTHFPKFDADKVIDNMMKGKNWKKGNKYWGLSKDQIKTQWSNNDAALLGTQLHFEIECFMNQRRFKKEYTHKDLYENYMADYKETLLETSLEWQYFIQFVKDTPELKPYRTEWTIYHEDLKLAGSIDMVYENPDGTLSIYDWKRTKDITRINMFNKFLETSIICHLPDTNFWHYALQLNTYKMIIEEKYDKKVTDLYLVRLHPNNAEKTYDLIQIPDLKIEINDLFEERQNQLIK